MPLGNLIFAKVVAARDVSSHVESIVRDLQSPKSRMMVTCGCVKLAPAGSIHSGSSFMKDSESEFLTRGGLVRGVVIVKSTHFSGRVANCTFDDAR